MSRLPTITTLVVVLVFQLTAVPAIGQSNLPRGHAFHTQTAPPGYRVVPMTAATQLEVPGTCVLDPYAGSYICNSLGGATNPPAQTSNTPQTNPGLSDSILRALELDSDRDLEKSRTDWEEVKRQIKEIQEKEDKLAEKLMQSGSASADDEAKRAVDTEISAEINKASPLNAFRQPAANEEVGQPRPNHTFSVEEYLQSDTYRNRLGLNRTNATADPPVQVDIRSGGDTPSSDSVVDRWLSPTFKASWEQTDALAARKAQLQQQLIDIEAAVRLQQTDANLQGYGMVGSYLGGVASKLVPPARASNDWQNSGDSIATPTEDVPRKGLFDLFSGAGDGLIRPGTSQVQTIP